mmetsp:Transcript_59087/g.137575  ORF Transcript_59087/g.137575 Transcript_59087/m.137575 type:complete len:258 (+) Transcript_59087:199-972(+)
MSLAAWKVAHSTRSTREESALSSARWPCNCTICSVCSPSLPSSCPHSSMASDSATCLVPTSLRSLSSRRSESTLRPSSSSLIFPWSAACSVSSSIRSALRFCGGGGCSFSSGTALPMTAPRSCLNSESMSLVLTTCKACLSCTSRRPVRSSTIAASMVDSFCACGSPSFWPCHGMLALMSCSAALAETMSCARMATWRCRLRCAPCSHESCEVRSMHSVLSRIQCTLWPCGDLGDAEGLLSRLILDCWLRSLMAPAG